MKIRFWGVRGSIPAPGPDTIRYGGNTACVSVTAANGGLLIIDMGTGLMHLGREGAVWMTEAIRAARADGTLRTAPIRDLLGRVLAAGHPVRIVYGRGGWVNVNDVAGLVDASSL